jgi:hypothetical protein
MSTPSFVLSEGPGGEWFAVGKLDSGREVRIACGKGSRERAEGMAEEKWRRRLQSAAASRKRWDKYRARSGAPAPAASSSAAKPDAAARNAEIRGKLLALGDAKPGPTDAGEEADPIEPDEVIPPGEVGDEHGQGDDEQDEAGEEEEEEGEDDEEAAEFLAEQLGAGTINLVSGLVTRGLKRLKPPRRPGEPHEKFVDFARQGATKKWSKLVGKHSKLSANGKLMVGLGGMIAMMVWNSEPIEQAKPAAAAPPAPTAAASPDAPEPAPSSPPAAAPPKLEVVKGPKNTPPPAPAGPPEAPLGKFS